MILKELSKKDKYWRSIAYNICKDKDLAKDLVQDMYLKVYEVSQKRDLDANDYYIIITIKNLFLDYCKENNKKVSTETLFYLEDNNSKYELNDEEVNILNNLTFVERELLRLNETMSFHEIQRTYNINYQFARRVILNVKEKYGKANKK
jgi:DNA-directed RNA polymerase specialized sigma24 family protein